MQGKFEDILFEADGIMVEWIAGYCAFLNRLS